MGRCYDSKRPPSLGPSTNGLVLHDSHGTLNAAKIPLRAISENGTIRFPIANNPYTPILRGGRHSIFVTDVTDVTVVTDVTDVTVKIIISPENHFIGVVFDGESHGDLHFGSFCRPDTVLALSSQSKGGSPRAGHDYEYIHVS